jgi:hypothetical protein
MVDMVTGKTVTDSMLSSARKKGNQIYKAVYGYQKVKHIDGTPVTYTSDYKGEEIVNHVYKLINLYGDSPLATEYYTDFRPSVLNNNTMKIDSEIPDVNIIDYFAPQIRDQLNKSISQEILTTEEATEAVIAEPISDERKAFIENRIRKLEQDIENGVAGPDTYSDIDSYRKELGITPNYEPTIPDANMAISNFYESLTPEQKAKLGPIEDVIANYESVPFDYSYEDYIESLNCKL